jgi:bifunctional oligoribonuclease and PAP phosphatase NrnA
MNEIDFKSLKNAIEGSISKKVFITFHSVGDTDSISAAFALARFFKNPTIATPDFITGNSKRILEKLGFDNNLIKTDFDEDADIVVLLDVNNFEDCGSFRPHLENFNNDILIIDHHTPNRIEKDNVIVFNSESYNSAASIVYDLIKSAGIAVDKNLANLIVAGIVSDSAELRNAFPKTFVQIGELLQTSGTDYQSLLLEMQHLASAKTREDFITDLFKAKITINNGLLMLQGEARIHANKIADDAIKIGADLAIFYTKSDREVSFSARLRPPLDKHHKINLGKIMKALAPLINGQGGGHPCAAGAYGTNKSNSMAFIDAFLAEINKKTAMN